MGKLKKIRAENIMTQTELAKKLGVSQSAVSQSRHVVRNLSSVDANATYVGLNELQVEQIRKERALADKYSLEVAEKAGQVVQFEPLKAALEDFGQTVRDQMTGIPDRVAGELAALTDARMVRDRLLEEIRVVLKGLPDVFAEISKGRRGENGLSGA